MRLKWYGHAAFLLESSLRIITDPYEPMGLGGAIGYGPIPDEADIVLVSHDHADHNHVQGLKGRPEVVRTPGVHVVRGVRVEGIPTFHDDAGGRKRGSNLIFLLELEGMRVCHLGDLGHLPSREVMDRLRGVDLLMLPVGGTYTIGPQEASHLWEEITPRLTVPMHYRTERCGLPLASVEEFLQGKPRVERLEASELTVTPQSPSMPPSIVVLRPAC